MSILVNIPSPVQGVVVPLVADGAAVAASVNALDLVLSKLSFPEKKLTIPNVRPFRSINLFCHDFRLACGPYCMYDLYLRIKPDAAGASQESFEHFRAMSLAGGLWKEHHSSELRFLSRTAVDLTLSCIAAHLGKVSPQFSKWLDEELFAAFAAAGNKATLLQWAKERGYEAAETRSKLLYPNLNGRWTAKRLPQPLGKNLREFLKYASSFEKPTDYVAEDELSWFLRSYFKGHKHQRHFTALSSCSHVLEVRNHLDHEAWQAVFEARKIARSRLQTIAAERAAHRARVAQSVSSNISWADDVSYLARFRLAQRRAG